MRSNKSTPGKTRRPRFLIDGVAVDGPVTSVDKTAEFAQYMATAVNPKVTRFELPLSLGTRMRRFVLNRQDDKTGTSGTGIVAEGVQLSSGQVVLTWLRHLNSVAVYHSMDVMETIHGHGGATRVHWIDP